MRVYVLARTESEITREIYPALAGAKITVAGYSTSLDDLTTQLAASQADSVALESALIQQGLLTHALVRDGLESTRADFRPVDQRITLEEWLRYGTRRVPELFAEVHRGRIQTFGRGLTVTVSGSSEDLEPGFQQPALFDYSRSNRPIVLTRED